MFSKFASDALGISDIGSVIKPADYNKVEADDYVMHEEEEKIYFLIKSKSDEYCFTNFALIHVDGTSAVSKKRTLRRYDYLDYTIHSVALETAGTIDLDLEIKFSIGQSVYSIDVNRKYIEAVKDLYKALIRIGALQVEHQKLFRYAETSLQTASASVNRASSPVDMAEQFKNINEYSFKWLKNAHDRYHRRDFGEVYELFIKN